MESPPTRTKLFKLSVYDEKHFILSFHSLDADTYNYAHDLVAGFPERRFRKSLNAWIIPFTESTFDYLTEKFHEDEYDLDADATIVAQYHLKTRVSLTEKEKRRWLYVYEDEVPTIPYEPYTEGYKHQVVGLDAIHGTEYFGVLYDTGCGKTWVLVNEARWSADERHAAGKGALKLLVVCPKGLRGTWMHELKKHLPPDYPYWVKRTRGGRLYAVQDCINFCKAEGRLKILICSYEQVVNMQEELKKMRFHLMVCDEITHAKNPSAKRTKAVTEVGRTADRRAMMTGTIVANNILDVFAPFRFLQDGCLGYDTFANFKRRYAKISTTESGWEQIVGAKNLEELKGRMAKCSFVVRKRDCLDLPEKQFQIHPVEMGDKQRDIYDRMVAHCVADLDEHMGDGGTASADIILTQFLRMSQMCAGFVRNEELEDIPIRGGDVKLQMLEEIVESLPLDSRFLVWTRFTWTADRIRELLNKMGIEHGELKGRTSEKRRDQYVESFNAPNGIRAIVGEAGCAGYGLTLLGTKDRPCSDVIYLDCDFSSLKRQQSMDRAHRIGMHCPVTYHDIVCEDSIDLRIAEMLLAKKELGELVKDYSSVRRLLLGDG
jgi:SNF2 family DNA or RNA helicase